MDAENIDLDADSFDAVICQLGLMVFPNPAKVLRAMRHVVRQGGKVAALVFSTAKKNPFQGVTLGVARRFGSTPLPLFSLGETDVLDNTFRESGLLNITVRPVRFPTTLLVHRRGDPKVEGKRLSAAADRKVRRSRTSTSLGGN